MSFRFDRLVTGVRDGRSTCFDLETAGYSRPPPALETNAPPPAPPIPQPPPPAPISYPPACTRALSRHTSITQTRQNAKTIRCPTERDGTERSGGGRTRCPLGRTLARFAPRRARLECVTRAGENANGPTNAAWGTGLSSCASRREALFGAPERPARPFSTGRWTRHCAGTRAAESSRRTGPPP
jgi:hypothetical protein